MAEVVFLLVPQDAVHAALDRALRDGGLSPVRVHARDDLAARLAQGAPSLVLADLALDENAALSAVEWLRAMDRGARTPILLMGTGRQKVRSSVDALRHHADDYLQRPLPAGQLLDRMARYLKRPAPALGAPHAVIPADDALSALPSASAAPHPLVVPGGNLRAGVLTAAPTWNITGAPTDGRVSLIQPAEGTLTEGALPALLWTAARQGATCRVDLVGPGQQARSLFLEGGRPVAMLSALAQDHLAEFLLHRGLITPSQAVDVRALTAAGPRPLAAALVQQGVLKAHELYDVVRDHLSDRVMALLEWSAATYRCVPDVAPEPLRTLLDEHPTALLWRGIRRKFPAARLLPLLGGADALVVPHAQVDLADVGLSEPDARAVALLDGTHTVRDVAAKTGLPDERVMQLALLLLCAGAARLAGRGSSSLPASTLGAGTGGGAAADAHIDRARIQEQHRRCLTESYFSMLGLPVGASASEVAEALAALRTAMDPQRFSNPALGDLLPVLQDIQAILGECADVLLTDGRRERYQAALGGPAGGVAPT